MFKRFSLITVMIFALPGLAAAAQIGGLSQNMGAQLLTVSANVGFIDRDVKNGGGKGDFNSRSFIIKTTYGVSDKLDAHFDIGFADVQDLPGFNGSLGTAIGGGVKYLLFEGTANNTRVSIDASILTFESEDSGKGDADYLEYSVAAVISKKSGNLTPFGGFRFSDVDIDSSVGDFKADDKFGLFAGADYFVNPNVYFTGELHVFAENTIYLGAGYNF